MGPALPQGLVQHTDDVGRHGRRRLGGTGHGGQGLAALGQASFQSGNGNAVSPELEQRPNGLTAELVEPAEQLPHLGGHAVGFFVAGGLRLGLRPGADRRGGHDRTS
jgi:hypothetical protein